MAKKQKNPEHLKIIPGIGPSLEKNLMDLGYHQVSQLRNADPEGMYQRLCALRGVHVDRCVLYAFRCAVYYASNSGHDPERLNWWNWKDVK